MKGHCTEGVTCTLVGRDRYIQGETFNWNPPQQNLVQDQTAPEFINCKSLLRDLEHREFRGVQVKCFTLYGYIVKGGIL